MYGRTGTGKNNYCRLMRHVCTQKDDNYWNIYWPKRRAIEVPSMKDKVCSHLDIYQKTKSRIDYCKTLKTVDQCRPKATLKYMLKFGGAA
jgi:hypothetical protein